VRARAVRFHEFGGPDVLRVEEIEVPPPGPGEVLLRVAAFGLNRVEADYRGGHFGPVTFPARIGYEAAGLVECVGEGVSEWRPGDRVATLYGLSMEQYGTHADAVVYPADMLVRIAPEQSLTDAAASMMQFGTAYALIDAGRIGSDDFVVISAASSSVGLAAIQIANERRAVPIAVTRGRDKAADLTRLGAAHVIVSDEEDVAARVLEITGGKGARVVFDAVAGEPLAALLDAAAPTGLVIVYGMLAGPTVELLLPTLMLKNLTLRGFAADLLVRQPESRARMLAYLEPRLANGTLRPVIDTTFDLAEVAEAHRRLESNRQLGKIVVTTGAVPE
jgi:NADPH:quinone reductase